MAEKKFFVDINLQGSALTNAKIGTNTGIGSTEGAFGYDSSAHRLQYFDGTATKEVANLTDIATVTGGLIFQGGYDPTTNTPDITDGSALKGFFWVATAAGTFLGEAVQVGDSIVAKADAAGTTLSDWLILQGNVVIATDSVDGISRLATQTEANDGTEAGAVVITPATLQGKIDAQITPEINNKLPLAGGTMSGNINMDGNEITNVNSVNSNWQLEINSVDNITISSDNGHIDVHGDIVMNGGAITGLYYATADGDATNKLYVDDQDALKLSLTGGTMSGNIDMDGNNITNVGNGTFDYVYTDRIAEKPGSDNIKVDVDLDFQNAVHAINLPAPTDGGDATNKTYVDDQDALKLDLAGGTMTGGIDMGGNAIYNGGNVSALSVQAPSMGMDYLSPFNETSIIIYGDINGQGSKTIINLPAPTANGDAANKEYVDTAESNANAYTDTEIAAQSFTGVLLSSDWTLNGSTYEAVLTHNLNSTYPIAVFFDNSTGKSAEFAYEPTGDFINNITVYSNILPVSIQVSLVAVR